MAIARRYPCIALWATMLLVAVSVEDVLGESVGVEDVVLSHSQTEHVSHGKVSFEGGAKADGDHVVLNKVESILHSAGTKDDKHHEMMGEGMDAQMEVCDKTWCRPKGKSTEAVYTPNNKKYTAVGVLHKDTPNFEVTFAVQAKNDAHIAFSNTAGFDRGGRKTYEIVIGGWSNRKSVLRPARGGHSKAAYQKQILDADDYKKFWIKKIGSTIMVGKQGDKAPFMKHTWFGGSVVPQVKHIGVMTGWGATGKWKDIDVKPIKYESEKLTFQGKAVTRIQVAGQMTANSMFMACQTNGLYPVCYDHNSFDGTCEVIEGSFKSQADMKGVFLHYKGGAPRMNPGSHRANSQDQDAQALCTARRKQSQGDFRFHHYKMYRVKVNGAMTAKNIAKACKARSMKPVCDHQSYRDKKCKSVGNRWHFSHTSHNKQHGIEVSNVKWAFFYAKNDRSLLNNGRGHRWSRGGDKDGDTFCVKSDKDFLKKHGKFTFNNRKIQRLEVKGVMNSENIYAACVNNGMRPVCDHGNSYDGLCEVLHKKGNDKWHFHKSKDTKGQGIPKISMEGVYMYVGRQRGGSSSIKHLRNKHRWANSNDQDGHTICTKPAETIDEFEWKDWRFVRVQVTEKINSGSIRKACHAQGLEPLCDSMQVSDGKCRTTWYTDNKKPQLKSWYFSKPSDDKRYGIPIDKLKGAFFYAGKQRNGKRTRVNNGRTHFWSEEWMHHADTICVSRTAAYTKKHKGDWGYLVPGMVVALQGGRSNRYCADEGNVKCNRNEPNQWEQFTVAKLGDKQGRFALKGGRKGKYCADEGSKWNCNRDKPGQWEQFVEVHVSQDRIALIGGRNGKLCADETNQIRCNRNGLGGWEKFTIECMKNCATMENEEDEKKYGMFQYRGRSIQRVQVKGVMNSKNIYNTCQAKGMKPLCDHANYFDGRCEVVGDNWHFSHPSHTRHHAKKVNKKSLKGVFVYAGYARGDRSMKRLRNRHRWSTNSDKDMKTLCVKPFPTASRKIEWDGFELHRVQVKGKVNSHSILKACEAKSMSPLCDHGNYQDGKCKHIGERWHFSHPAQAKRHEVPTQQMSWAFFYCGTANGNKALINTGKSHKWSSGRETDGDTYCVKRSANFMKKHGVFDFYGRKLTRVNLKGQMNSDNIWKACQTKGMRPVCDHANYFDGRCEVVHSHLASHGRWHFSHPHHTKHHGNNKIPKVSVNRAFFYAGSAHHKQSMKRRKNGHRWSTNKDKNQDTFCVLHADRKKDQLQYKHYDLIRVAVKGKMNSANLIKACKAHSMKPVCDHRNYADGKCLNIMNNWHLSHPSHAKKHLDAKKLEWAYFYTNNHNKVLMNNVHGHRWSQNGKDQDGDTFCAVIDKKRFEAHKRKYWNFEVAGHDIKRVRVIGSMQSDEIWKACQAKGMRPVCDHANYFDGRCVVVGMHHNHGRWHMSHPHHTKRYANKISSESLVGAFMYAGISNHKWALLHTETSHRWSNKNDRDGTTLCTKAPDISKTAFTYKGYKLTRVRVRGKMDAKNIFETCEEKGMRPVCDHSSYNDGKCQAFGSWHWSHPHHIKHHAKVDQKKVVWAFFYASGNRALVNTNHGHRWYKTQHGGDRDGDTFCVKADEEWLKKFGVFKFNGQIINRIQVTGKMNSENIYNACLKHKMRPVCDHASYADGFCELLGDNWHFSHPHHTRRHASKIPKQSLNGAFMYCGHANHYRSLQHNDNGHRWSNDKDTSGQTLCTKVDRKNVAHFEYRGYDLVRVQVKEQITSQNIVKACDALKMKPLCDRLQYNDGHCQSMGNSWHFSHPHHTRHRKIEQKYVQNVFFYSGKANHNKALVNTGKTHKWSRGQKWEKHADTMCAAKSKDFLKKHGKFKFNGFNIERVAVIGHMNRDSVWKACQVKGLRPVCDHGTYYDGRCVVVTGNHNKGHWHLSHRSHKRSYGKDIPNPSIEGAYMYCGHHNGGKTLFHPYEGNGHRWSTNQDKDGHTLCTKPSPLSFGTFHLRGFKLQRVPVEGDMNGKNILKACKTKGLKPVCDHQAYKKNSDCKSFGNWHMSNPGSLKRYASDDELKARYSFFYANNNRARRNNGHSSAWAKTGHMADKDGDAYCVSDQVDEEYLKKNANTKFNGHTLTRVKVQGKMTSQNIFKACIKQSLRPVCDHGNYRDGMCEHVGGNWHFSHPHHTKHHGKIKDSTGFRGVYFYCGHSNGYKSLLHRANGHRWSTDHDENAMTMCTNRKPVQTFEWRGWDFSQVLVKDKINSQSIRKACEAKGSKPVCDHNNYGDDHCKSFRNNWHWGEPNHVKHHAKIDLKRITNVFFYAGRANGGKASVNTGRNRVWSRNWEYNGFTMCVKKNKEFAKKYHTFKLNGFSVERVEVSGEMKSENIWKACKAKDLRPVCDHTNYADGRCVVVGGASTDHKNNQGHWHLSLKGHTNRYAKNVKHASLAGVFVYCGRANHQRSLLHTYSGSHRWSNNHDRNGQTLCAKPADRSKSDFTYRGDIFKRVAVNGPMDNQHIMKACEAKGMQPVCDHHNHGDTNCKRYGHWHWSHPHHVTKHAKDFVNKVRFAFFYVAGHRGSMFNNGHSHRWYNKQDRNGDTYCVKADPDFLKKYGIFTHKGVTLQRVEVSGIMNSKNMYNACQKHNMKPVCDHRNYYDGMCVVIANNAWHWSHPHHTRSHTKVKKASLEGGFWYCGRASGDRSLYHMSNSHRWSSHQDRDGQTFCTKPPKAGKKSFEWHGYDMVRVEVKKVIRRDSILEACKARGMIPLCDHKNYGNQDPACKNLGNNWHFSHPHHVQRHARLSNDLLNGAFLYTGNANSHRVLVNARNTHYWSRDWENHADTVCVDYDEKKYMAKYGKFKVNGAELQRVNVKGRMNAPDIWKACQAKGLRPVCDHSNYFDGRCVVLKDLHNYGRWHWSHNSHTNQWAKNVKKRSLHNAFFYTGYHHTGALLHKIGGGHRWANGADRDGQTVCSASRGIGQTDFKYQGYHLKRIKVKGEMLGNNINKACQAIGMQPLCDHKNYQDGNCRSFGTWHFSHPHHLRHHAKELKNEWMEYAFFYAKGNRALFHTGHGHRWADHRMRDGDTFCVKPDSEWLKNHGMFKYKQWNIRLVQVKGVMESTNLAKACASKGLVPVCDHKNYADGVCETIAGVHHWSHPHHTKHTGASRARLHSTYMYTGCSNGGKALQDIGNTHRWATHHDKDGRTLCTKSTQQKSGSKIDWRGYELMRVKINGQVNHHNMRKACAKHSMKPLCDHNNYNDGTCHNFGNHWHFSHQRDVKKHMKRDNNFMQGVAFYASGNRALVNSGHSHHWTCGKQSDIDTMCTRISPNFLQKYGKFTFNGRTVKRIQVSGIMNSQNIFKACLKHNLRPVCDHQNYLDGLCVRLDKGWHWSHNGHTNHHAKGVERMALQGAFMYCGRGNGDRSLEHKYAGSHRWSNNNDKNKHTLCTKRTTMDGVKIKWEGMTLERVQVSQPINSASIRKACKDRKLKPVCDHQNYYDGHCKNMGNHWHFSHPHHVKKHMRAIDSKLLENLAVYAGKAHGNRALVNTGHTHYWSRGWEHHIDTLCVLDVPPKPAKVVSGSIVAFKSARSNRYCRAADQWNCNTSRRRRDNKPDNADKFKVVDAGGGHFGLRSLHNQRFCADENHHARIICNRGHLHQWEKFRFKQAGGNKISIMGGRQSRFCRDEGNRVRCDQTSSALQDRKYEMQCLEHCTGGAPVKIVVNSVVAIRGGRHGRWCASEHSLNCNRGHIQQWEKYKVMDAGGGRVAFQSVRFKKYCRDHPDGNQVRCNAGGIGRDERFTYGQAGGGQVWLRSGRTGKYCFDGGSYIRCDRNGYGHHLEKFVVRCVENCDGKPNSPPIPLKNGMIIAFKGGHRNKWCAQPGGKNERNHHRFRWECNRGHKHLWEKFRLVDAGSHRWGFQSLHSGKYCKDHNNWISCNANHLGHQEKFEIKQLFNGTVAIKGGRGHRWCRDKGTGAVCHDGNYNHRENQWVIECVQHCNGAPPKPKKLVPGSIVAFKGGKHNRWCANEMDKWRCNRGHVHQWEKYEVVSAPGGKYGFKSLRNHRFCADEVNRLRCNRGHLGQWEQFQVLDAGGGKSLLKGGHHRWSKYCIDHGNQVTCNQNSHHNRAVAKFYIHCVQNCHGSKFKHNVAPGRYRILTSGGPGGGQQPHGWGLSAWNAHGARRNHASSWVAVHSGNHWPMVWDIRYAKKAGTYWIKTTNKHPSHHQPGGWGLSAWHAHGAKRDGASSRVAVHSGNVWLMDWEITPSNRGGGRYWIKTAGGPGSGRQPGGWGLCAWNNRHIGGAHRNHASSWVYVHRDQHWWMDWKLERV
jgi:hypothetical protein